MNLVLVVLSAVVLTTLAAPLPTTVTTTTGPIQGMVVDGTRQFLGVPFAKQPVGELRWRRPVAPEAWSEVLPTVEPGPACAQPRTGYVPFNNISEACLYLNVYAPTEMPEGPVPVMVFFYGGSWEWGSNSVLSLYDGSFDLEAWGGDAVIVVPNYRLGPFGWLASPLLAKEDPKGSTGNYGLQDQRLALQWVADNIAKFGGDPNLVTIWGESAGAGSVSSHLVTPDSFSLYHHAIMESGPPANWTAVSLAEAEEHFARVATVLGCSGADELACMRSQSTEVLLKHQENVPGSLVSYTPVVDGVEMTAIPPELVRHGKYNKVPVIMGSNRDEGTLFVPIPHDATTAQLEAWVNNQFGAELAKQVLAAYPADRFGNAFWRGSRIFGDAAMTCPVRRDARWMSAWGAPVYTYFFTHQALLTSADVWLGVFHGSDVPFVFADAEFFVEAEEVRLANDFGTFWHNFAKSGNPNTGAPVPIQWPRYSNVTDLNINFDLTITYNTQLKSVQCDLWDSIYLAQHP